MAVAFLCCIFIEGMFQIYTTKKKVNFHVIFQIPQFFLEELNNDKKCIRDCIVVFEATACSLIEYAKCKSTFIKFMYYFAFSSVQLWHFSICISC